MIYCQRPNFPNLGTFSILHGTFAVEKKKNPETLPCDFQAQIVPFILRLENWPIMQNKLTVHVLLLYAPALSYALRSLEANRLTPALILKAFLSWSYTDSRRRLGPSFLTFGLYFYTQSLLPFFFGFLFTSGSQYCLPCSPERADHSYAWKSTANIIPLQAVGSLNEAAKRFLIVQGGLQKLLENFQGLLIPFAYTFLETASFEVFMSDVISIIASMY